jgi:hypothetical protein
MTIIDDELDEIRRCCENVIPDSKVVACVPAMIRVEIRYFLFDTCLAKINITIKQRNKNQVNLLSFAGKVTSRRWLFV